ncbi:MAG: aspartyl protease family protein [Candidatus Eremiobacteraeota bacterium]|nr:aspartyl protease family protein [Candidatus Eremiobacteraeota bacterium]
MIDRRTFLASGAAAVLLGAKHVAASPGNLTESFELLDNRAFVTVRMQGRNQQARDVSCWFDTGGGVLLITRDVARSLALEPTGAIQSNEDEHFQTVSPPRISIGGIDIPVSTSQAMISLGGATTAPGIPAQGFLPGHLLRDHRVLIDYPARRFGLDSLPDSGAARIPIQIDPRSGFIRIEAVIDGERVGLLLDTGASSTMLSRAFVDRLLAKHPEWKHASGAYGPANMSGTKTDLTAKMLRVPQLEIGSVVLHDVVAVSRPVGVFEQWMSSMLPSPIVGALGGNALRNLRIQIDYPQNQLTALHTDSPVAHEFDVVPLTLMPTYHGYQITGVMPGAKVSAAPDALIGKQLIAIDDETIEGKDLGQVFGLLRGKPGTSRRLRVGSSSSSQVVTATISHVL